MFSKLALLTFVAPLVSALTISAPSTQCASGGQCTIDWTSEAGDPATFSLELVNVNTAFPEFAIKNSLSTQTGSITLELPIVAAGDGYILEAVQISDVNQVIAKSDSFSISAQSSSSSSSSSSSTSASTSSSSSSGAKSGSTTTAIPTATPATTSAFGVTNTAPTSSITPAGTSTGTGTAAAGAATSSAAHFNAASSLSFGFNAGSVAVLLLSAVAGAAVVAL